MKQYAVEKARSDASDEFPLREYLTRLECSPLLLYVLEWRRFYVVRRTLRAH